MKRLGEEPGPVRPFGNNPVTEGMVLVSEVNASIEPVLNEKGHFGVEAAWL